MNAVERVTEYSPLPAEAEGQQDVLHVPPEWPSKGAIEVQDLVVSDGGCALALCVCAQMEQQSGATELQALLVSRAKLVLCQCQVLVLRLTCVPAAQHGDHQVQDWVTERRGQARVALGFLMQMLRERPSKDAAEVQWGNKKRNSIDRPLLLCPGGPAEE